MLTLTIRQPFVELIFAGLKKFEYRSWQTSHRGPLLIHAAMRFNEEAFDELMDEPRKRRKLGLDADPRLARRQFVTSAIVGEVQLVDIRATDEGWAWKLARPRRFRRPVPATGRLMLWQTEVPAALRESLIPRW